MVEKIGHVRNPLTVIAIFAGIAEISGTVVLPFVAPENQKIYIWFLMTFPFFLVGVFFLTLHFNPTALYSPSDYKDENNFVNSIRKATPEELRAKLRQEVKEVEAEIDEQNCPAEKIAERAEQATEQASEEKLGVKSEAKRARGETEPRKVRDAELVEVSPALANSMNHSRVISDLALAETLAISRLSKNLSVPFQRNVTIALPGRKGVTFDGFSILDDEVHAVEVKLFARNTIDVSRFHTAMVDAKAVALHLRTYKSQHFTYHIFIVANASAAQKHKAISELMSLANSIGLTVKVYISPMPELISEFEHG